MKEVKQFSKGYILSSVVCVVLGAALLAWPSTSVKMVCYGLGLAMLILGLTYGILYFTKDGSSGMELVIGIVCLAFGVFVLLKPTFLGEVLPFAMGIILLLGAVVKIQNALQMKRLLYRRWYVALICALVLAALGVVFLCNIIKQEKYMILYTGICLILDGAMNLVIMFCVRVRVRKLNKIQQANPDVDVQELLEQHQKEAAEQKRRTVEVKAARKAERAEAKARREAEKIAAREADASSANSGEAPGVSPEAALTVPGGDEPESGEQE